MTEQKEEVIENGRFRIYLKDPIGKGAYGSVYFAENLDDMEMYAAKILENINSGVTAEIQNLMKMSAKSDHIIKFVDFFFHDHKAVIITEYCDSSLVKVLKDNGGKLTENLAQLYFIQLLMGLKDMHDNGLMHRDIKIENVFLKDGVLKLGDLGFATNKLVTESVVGSPIYMSPELLKQAVQSMKPKGTQKVQPTDLYPAEPKTEKKGNPNPFAADLDETLKTNAKTESWSDSAYVYDKNIDVWSCGILLYQMVFGDLPFKIMPTGNPAADLKNLFDQLSALDEQKLFKNQKTKVSDGLRDLLLNMLKPSANDRFKFSTIWRSEWVTEGMIRYHGKLNVEKYLVLSSQSQVQLSSIGFASRINKAKVKNRRLIETYNLIKRQFNNNIDHVKVLNLLENILLGVVEKYRTESKTRPREIRGLRPAIAQFCVLYFLLKRKQLFELTKLKATLGDPTLTAIMIGSDPATCEKVLKDLSADEFAEFLGLIEQQIGELVKDYTTKYKELKPELMIAIKLAETRQLNPETPFSDFNETYFLRIKDEVLTHCRAIMKDEQITPAIQVLAKKFFGFENVYDRRKGTDNFKNLAMTLENISDIDLNEIVNSELEFQMLPSSSSKLILTVLAAILVLFLAFVVKIRAK